MQYYVQTSLTGLAIVAIIFFNLRARRRGRQLTDTLFALMLLTNAALLLGELLLNVLSGRPGTFVAVVLPAVVATFYALNPVPSALWLLYVYSLLLRREQLSRALLLAVVIPLGLFAALAFASIAGGYAFVIGAANVYGRGPYFLVMPALCYAYLVLPVYLVISRRAALRRRELVSLLVFPLLPLLAGTLQVLVYGVSVVWLAMALALLIVYLDVQSAELSTDYLTGLANRRRLDAYLEGLGSGSRRGRFAAGIMIDIDGFKQINDVYGHEPGDRALEAVAALLRRSVPRDDLVARYGGDEFAVVLLVDDERELGDVVRRIEAAVDELNTPARRPYALRLSIGTTLHDLALPLVAKDFVKRMDDSMYAARRLRRAQQDAE